MMDDHQCTELNNISSPRGGGSPSTHRWNPTKEQINMLESMYQQGIRTPSAEQIQDMTTKLKVYGHIEGKNVFYWFQNHKARQRQKEKQDHRMAESFNRLFQHSSPLFPPPPCPNVVCSPYYLGPGPIGFYPQCPPKLFLPATIGKKRSHVMPSESYVGKPNFWDHGDLAATGKLGSDHHICIPLMRSPSTQETLELFPMHPTGILQEKSKLNESPEISNVTTPTSTTPSSSSDTTMCLNEQEAAAVADQRFFEFFTGNIGAPFDQSQ